MSNTVVIWAHERSPDLQEIVEFSVFVSSGSRSVELRVVLSDGVGQQLAPSVVADLLAVVLLLLGLHSLQEVIKHLLFQRSLAVAGQLRILVLLLQLFVVDFVHQQLGRVLVVRDQLEVSVGLVDHSPLATVLQLLDRSFAFERSQEHFSESEDELFLRVNLKVLRVFGLRRSIACSVGRCFCRLGWLGVRALVPRKKEWWSVRVLSAKVESGVRSFGAIIA